MKKSFLSLFLCILVLAGCKKESNELNRGAVSLIMLPVESDGVSSFGYNYKLKAMIVAPAKLEVEDHGFLIIGGGTTSVQPLPLGSGALAGRIESDYPSPLPEGQFTVAAYAKLKNGETIYSIGYTQDKSSEFVSITSGYYTNSYGPTTATFEGNIFNPNTGKYVITEIGVEYALTSEYSTNGGNYTDDLFASSGSSAPNTPIFLQYPIDGFTFYGKADYNYRIYAKVLDLATTNINTIYGPDGTFSTD